MDTPLVQAIKDYISEELAPFHMPGHKGGRGFSSSFLSDLVKMDVTEVPGLDNLQAPTNVIKDAQRLAAEAFQSDACFFLVNGSTSGLHIMIMTAVKPGDSIIIPRNCHKSVWDALVISGAMPIYIQPEYDNERCLITQVAISEVKRVVEENPNAVGMLLTNPNYYGMCPDMKAIRSILTEHNMMMLVDEAHGAHFIFHNGLPPSSAECGADIWVQSAHKTLPAFTQSSYLHVKHGIVDFGRLTQLHRMLQSTSPSYLLMASLDWARGYMVEQGKNALDKLLDNLSWTRKELKAIGIDTMEDYKRPEVYMTDATRLVLDLSNLGLTGYEGEKILRGVGIQVEMSDLHRVVLICTVADRKPDFEKLVKACHYLRGIRSKCGKKTYTLSISREIPKQMLSPKEAFDRKREYIPIKGARGRICSGLIGAYPPGIPRFCPGELLDNSGIEELLEIKAWGGQLFGLSEDELIPVVAE